MIKCHENKWLWKECAELIGSDPIAFIYFYICIYILTYHISYVYITYISHVIHTHIYTYTYITTHLILLLKLLLLPLTNVCVWSLSTSSASILAWPNHNKNWSNYLKVYWLIPFFGPVIQGLAIYQTREDNVLLLSNSLTTH